MDATTWDMRYTCSELVWGAAPNRFVAAELEGLQPGRALDIACGEGRNTIWLATRGWQATGIDFSAVALDRAARLAAEAGVEDRVTFVVGDVEVGELPTGPFDAVVVAYLQLPEAPRRSALRRGPCPRAGWDSPRGRARHDEPRRGCRRTAGSCSAVHSPRCDGRPRGAA